MIRALRTMSTSTVAKATTAAGLGAAMVMGSAGVAAAETEVQAPGIYEVTAQMTAQEAVEYAIADAEHVHMHHLIRGLKWVETDHAQAWRADAATELEDSLAIQQLRAFAATKGVTLDVFSTR
ncbi:MAG TPA: hypothetical protein H9867_07700 [Candidatus Corynebacterium gallistercoris]|uniref:Secreted protein n=1 Tax=Candidatus Corynebacterium gallistercoris TaxID=2838530 RepID=A0A9D1RXY3_9CORY|nr:hypothetical protein [Candidatus Corynebacterium gallistercoris]